MRALAMQQTSDRLSLEHALESRRKVQVCKQADEAG